MTIAGAFTRRVALLGAASLTLPHPALAQIRMPA